MRQALAGRRQHAEVGYIKICNGFVNVLVSIKSQMYFINASSLIFQTLVYFKGNLVHMFFILLYLTHQMLFLKSYLMSKKTLELDLNPFQSVSPYLLFKTRKASTPGKT